MKITLALFAITFLSSSSYAETILRCKRRDLFAASSYQWVEILKMPDRSLQFQYGIGIDTQMVELDFSSSVTEVEKNHFVHQEASYSLDSTVVNSKLSFSVKAGTQTTGGKTCICF